MPCLNLDLQTFTRGVHLLCLHVRDQRFHALDGKHECEHKRRNKPFVLLPSCFDLSYHQLASHFALHLGVSPHHKSCNMPCSLRPLPSGTRTKTFCRITQHTSNCWPARTCTRSSSSPLTSSLMVAFSASHLSLLMSSGICRRTLLQAVIWSALKTSGIRCGGRRRCCISPTKADLPYGNAVRAL